jgi:hypothetical protein
MFQSMICDFYPYKYREVARDDPAATIDVYLAPPSCPEVVGDLERDCTHVATLARIHPTCCFCQGRMKMEGWDYGHDAAPVIAKGRCCTPCHDTIVLPVRAKQTEIEFLRYQPWVWERCADDIESACCANEDAAVRLTRETVRRTRERIKDMEAERKAMMLTMMLKRPQ